MGRQAFPIIGGIIGAVAGTFLGATWQGAEAGFAIGAALGGIAGSYIDPIVIQGNQVGDTALQVAAEGGARAIIYGRACVTSTCVVARGNRQLIKKKTSNGKGSSGTTENETVTWTFAIALGEALVNATITRIWQDENLVFDILSRATISEDDNNKFRAKFRFYDGNEGQLPDADLQTFLADDTPYFRGTAYVVFPNFDLTATQERIPIFKFEIANAVAGIVDEIDTLRWDFPDPLHSNVSSQSVTLTGNPDTTLLVNMYLTGHMETRPYSDHPQVVGGGGRFVVAESAAVSDGSRDNIYRIEVSDPAAIVYVNSFKAGETAISLFEPDGSDAYTVQLAINAAATITFYADGDDGLSNPDYGAQYGSVRSEIVGQLVVGDSVIPLSTIALALAERAGMDSSQLDVSALADDLVAGVCIQSTVNGMDAINACVQPFFADPCEADRVIKYVKRGAPVVRTLTIDDLTETPDIASRENVIEYPAKLHFFYQSPLTGYATTKATSYRYSPQADSSGEGSVTAPITFYDSDMPAQIAAKLHKVMWTEAAGSFDWVVGSRCIDLVPTDVVGLFLRGQSIRARIVSIENDGNTFRLSMIKDRQSSYTSVVTGIPLPTPTPPQPTTMSKAVLAVMDIPALQDTDDELCYYTAISGSTATWRGAQLQRSLDGGASWTVISEVITDVTMGRLTVAMTAEARTYTDTTNTITVQLFDPANDLVGYSDVTFLQEQGAVAIELADGTYEVLQYRDATDGGNGLWTLSYLQRGRLNTVAGSHAIGSLFVLLADAVAKQSAQTAWLGGTMKHRAVSYSTSAEDADIVTNVYAGRSQLEWSPASASAEYDGTFVYVHDIHPRHRFGTELNPIASANFQGFRVTIVDGSNSLTADILFGDSAHITSAPIVVPTSVSVQALNKYTGAGEALFIIPVAVTAGSLTPVAIVNAGGAT